jgi:DNA-binding response OmpR family regulator
LEVADGGIHRDDADTRVDVCVVDDDKEHGRSLSRLLRGFGLKVGQSDSLESFLRDFASEDVPSILCDAHMPDGGAERLLPILARSSKPPRLAVVSGDSSDDQLYRLAGLGAQAFFTKPVDVDEVVAWVRGGG